MGSTIDYPQLIERGCGLDVHKESVTATIKGTGIREETRTFGTFTCDLLELGTWLSDHQVTHVIYWKPVFGLF